MKEEIEGLQELMDYIKDCSVGSHEYEIDPESIEYRVKDIVQSERKKTLEEVKYNHSKEMSYESKYSEVVEIIDKLFPQTTEGESK